MSTQSLPSTCYPAPPPTTNTLDPHQRTRLLKSARKLGAVLGTTPFLLEPPASPPKLSLSLSPSYPSTSPYSSYKEPPTPRTKKSRRSGRVFTPPSHSASSSTTSLSSFEESDDFVVIPPGGAGTGYHYHHLDISLPQNHLQGAIKVSLVPEPVPKTKKGPKALPPPLLLRLRAVPVRSDSRAGVRDSVVSTSTSSSAVTPMSPVFPQTQTQMKTEREKRKKMDKLSRTFGESVPPELVFPSAPAKKPTGPRPSDAQRRREKREGKKRAVYPLPPTPSPSPSSGLKQTPRRAPRPRSLTLVPPPSAFSSSTSSLPETKKTHKPALSTPTLPLTRPSTSGSRTSEGKTHHTMHCRAHTVDNGHTGGNARAKEEFGHRKEREWSGEWNVEIDDVVRRLRALKA